MTNLIYKHISKCLITLLLVLSGCTGSHLAENQGKKNSLMISADRVFDGYTIRKNTAVLIIDGKVSQIGAPERLKNKATEIIDLGDATLLPGFIELHAHLTFRQIPQDIILRHGITTIRDLGGPMLKPYGGDGGLRVLSAGPIITTPNGYPIPVYGKKDNAIPVTTEAEARKTVAKLIDGGAVIIKIALEPGGELGAPWSSGHAHSHGHKQHTIKQWPLLSEKIVTAIVDEAHKHNLKVTAHIGEAKGAEIAINSGVDEWAHMPCADIPEHLLRKAVEQKVKVVTTIDTLSKCSGIMKNTKVLASLGADLLYGSEIAHPDVPWGINSQELLYIKNLSQISVIDVLKMITSKAGRYLNIPLLGTLESGAPADIIAVNGNPINNLKSLEYPVFVMSGGKVIVDN